MDRRTEAITISPSLFKKRGDNEGSINVPLLMYVAVCHILCCFYTVGTY